VDSPALVIELKCDQTVEAAIDQIKRKNYPAKLADYAGNLLLVGINYDRKTKTHTCRIEKA
jgi:aminoglycoside N3'-acetyltransferase